MNTSDTPRVDAESSNGWSGDAFCVSADLARQLERELNEAKAEIEILRRFTANEPYRVKSALEQSRKKAFEEAAEICRRNANIHSNPDLADCHEQDALALLQAAEKEEPEVKQETTK